MNWVDDTIAAFGESLGVGALALDADGEVAFALADGAGQPCELLIRCPLGDAADATVSLRCETRTEAPLARAALRIADFRQGFHWQVQASGTARHLTLSVRIPRRAFLHASLEEAVDGLLSMNEAVRRGDVR